VNSRRTGSCRIGRIHEQNLVHRDIKPTNIMVTLKEYSVTAKIIDLGLEKTLDESASEAGLVMVNLGGVEIAKGETTEFLADMSLTSLFDPISGTRI
jgi:serine/threonine protein kinase